MTDYSLTTEVPIRFQDLDAIGHVNNAVYATLFEEARAAYFREVVDVTLHKIDTAIATIELDFRRPIDSTGPVTVAVGVPDLGTSSIPMDYEVRHDGAVAAEGSTVQVIVDGDTGESQPIPDAWREQIREFEGL